MKVPTLGSIDLAGRAVLLRADLNVPLEDGRVTDDTRITAVVPTIQTILAAKPRYLVLCSHLGRPDGTRDPAFSLEPVGRRMAEIMGLEVRFLGGPTGVDREIAALSGGAVGLLENLRYDPGEEAGDEAFAAALARPFEVFVQDAFGALHRPHASISVVTKLLPVVAGHLVLREVEALIGAIAEPVRPFYALLGGAKVSTKIGVIRNLLPKVDGILIGGGMAFTFLKALGQNVGKSLVEKDWVEEAGRIIEEARRTDKVFLLPRDHVVAAGLNAPSGRISETIGDEEMALDIGPRTRQDMVLLVQRAKTIIWNGPVGAFEKEPFSQGTRILTKALENVPAKVIVGGGDSVAAVSRFGNPAAFYHISTGGGASLELLEGRALPGIVALEEAIR